MEQQIAIKMNPQQSTEKQHNSSNQIASLALADIINSKRSSLKRKSVFQNNQIAALKCIFRFSSVIIVKTHSEIRLQGGNGNTTEIVNSQIFVTLIPLAAESRSVESR